MPKSSLYAGAAPSRRRFLVFLDGIGGDDVIVVDVVLFGQYWPVIPATFDFFFTLVNRSRFWFIVINKKGKVVGVLELRAKSGELGVSMI